LDVFVSITWGHAYLWVMGVGSSTGFRGILITIPIRENYFLKKMHTFQPSVMDKVHFSTLSFKTLTCNEEL
jgi:hypothetical protein